jgi:hypothetical protein
MLAGHCSRPLLDYSVRGGRAAAAVTSHTGGLRDGWTASADSRSVLGPTQGSWCLAKGGRGQGQRLWAEHSLLETGFLDNPDGKRRGACVSTGWADGQVCGPRAMMDCFRVAAAPGGQGNRRALGSAGTGGAGAWHGPQGTSDRERARQVDAPARAPRVLGALRRRGDAMAGRLRTRVGGPTIVATQVAVGSACAAARGERRPDRGGRRVRAGRVLGPGG